MSPQIDMQAMLKSQLAQTHGHNFQIFFFIKSDTRARAMRAAGSKRRSALEGGGSRPERRQADAVMSMTLGHAVPLQL